MPIRHSLVVVAIAIVTPPAHAQRPDDATLGWMTATSAAYVVSASFGAAVSIRDSLPEAPFGVHGSGRVREEFLRGGGTALSPGLIFLVTQTASTVLAYQPGQLGRAGAIALAVHGGAFCIGQLSEPLAWQTLRHPGAHPERTIIVIANVVLPAIFAVQAGRAAGDYR